MVTCFIPVLYINEDGQQCDGNEGPYCANTKMPCFIKTLNEATNDYTELKVCGNKGYPNEDTPLNIIELSGLLSNIYIYIHTCIYLYV